MIIPDENIEKKIVSDNKELTLDDMQTKFVSSPKVGEETEWLSIIKLEETKNVDRKDKEGNEFSVALPKVDYAIKMTTDKGELTINAWEVWGKVKEACAKNKSISGTQIKIKHIADGFKDKVAVKQKRCYQVFTKINNEEIEIIQSGDSQ